MAGNRIGTSDEGQAHTLPNPRQPGQVREEAALNEGIGCRKVTGPEPPAAPGPKIRTRRRAARQSPSYRSPMTNWKQKMEEALAEASQAPAHGDVPVGAVLVDPQGRTLASDHNRREEAQDPTAHAEMLVLSQAARQTGRWRLEDHTLVVTLEPCPMCAGAAVAARIKRLVYGAADLKTGAAWSLYNLPQDPRLNHHIEIVSGMLEEECSTLLADFFKNNLR